MPEPSLTAADLAARIDHTILKAEATSADVDRLIDEARQYRFASICVNGIFVAHVAGKLSASGVKTCSVVGFPLGAMTAKAKAEEARQAVGDGATEIDMVAHLPYLLSLDIAKAQSEFAAVAQAAKSANPAVMVKVILETSALMHGVSVDIAESRVATGCRAAKAADCDFVKTSTGFHPTGGATEQAVRWLKQYAHGMQVKASGGIRNLDDALKMLAAGADRLGCSAGVAIVQNAPSSSSPSPY